MWYRGKLNSTPRLGRMTPLSHTKYFLRILCNPFTSISLNISSICSCCQLASSCNRSTKMARYFILLVLTARSSRSNSADCKARKELLELNNLMKSRNVKLGFSTESGRRFKSEREEKEDREGDEDR